MFGKRSTSLTLMVGRTARFGKDVLWIEIIHGFFRGMHGVRHANADR